MIERQGTAWFKDLIHWERKPNAPCLRQAGVCFSAGLRLRGLGRLREGARSPGGAAWQGLGTLAGEASVAVFSRVLQGAPRRGAPCFLLRFQPGDDERDKQAACPYANHAD